MKRRILPMFMAVMMILSIIQMPAWATDGDGAFVEVSIDEGSPVQYDNQETFFQAFQEARGDIFVKLLSDVEISGYIPVAEGQNVTLDLNGCKLSTTEESEGRHYYAIQNSGVLTITDNSEGGNGSVVSRGIQNNSSGTMYMQGGTINSCDSNGGGAAIWNEGNLEMTGGKLVFSGEKNGNNAGAPLSNQAGATATITGGEFESPYTCIFNSGSIEIKDVTLSTSTGFWTAVNAQFGAEYTKLENVIINATSGGGISVNGGTADLINCTITQKEYYDWNSTTVAVSNGGVLNIYSGTYNSDNYGAYVFNSGGTINIYGGIFNGSKAVLKADNSTNENTQSVITVGGGKYTGDISIGDESTLAVSGGTFSSDVSQYVDASSGITKDSNGDWVVAPLTGENATASVGDKYYNSLSAAIAAAGDGDTVTLLKDTELTSVGISKGITLDLGGKTLKLVAGSTSPVGLSFSSGSSKITNGTIQDERVVVSGENNTAGYYMVVVNGDGTSLETSNVTMITNRPAISTNQYTYIIQLQNGSSATLNSGTVLKDQMYNGQTYETYGAVGVTVLGTNGGTTTSLTVNEGAEISTYGFAVSGNGTMHGTSITINGGEITSEISTAIYHPQEGEITINGDSIITGENAGIEIRSGELTVNGGTIRATAKEFECDPNGSGTTTVGAALAIAQHTTKRNITVTINGGTFSGVKALNESNPQENDPAPQVKLSVRDGDFQGEVTTADVDNFVSGGTFSSAVEDEYCAPGFEPTTTADGKHTVAVANDMTVKIVDANGNDVAAYENLSNAVKAVKSGQTIVLLEDVTDALPVPQVADVTYTAVDGVTVSGGMSGTVAGDLTLNGITFTQKDVYLNGKEDATVTVKDCTFSGVTAHGNKLGAFNMVTAGNLVFTGNTITGTKDAGGSTEAVGIYTQNLTDVTISDNTIGAVSGTSINVNGNKGTTTITGNELTDWASAGGNTPGRAIRLSDSGDGNVTITGNKLVNNKETLESYIKISGVEENSVDATKNYWNGKSPDAKAGDGNPLFEVADATVDGSKITSEPYFEAATMRDPEDLSNYVPPVDPDDDHGSSSSGSSSSVRRYDIEADAGRGGDISPDGRVRVRRGENQTFRITADDGYEIYDVEVDGESVGAVSRYTFENVREDHTISATFRQTGAQTEEAQLPFLDVAEGAWYYDAVAYCYENGIMDGTSSVSFAPGMLLNRAMAAQVLYNLADGTASTAAGFPDVAASAWYADAVNWAAANGYVTGYDNGSFGPEDSLTREQLAVILYRYAGSPEPTGSLDGFTDAASTSDYAVDALRWAVGEGLLTGKDGGRLDPAGTASRAELAQILARFAQM